MKALEDALAANDFSDQMTILKSVSPKEYPALIRAIQEKRQSSSEYRATLNSEEIDDFTKSDDFRKQDLCLEAAEMIASLAKKTLGFYPHQEIWEREEIMVYLTLAEPLWLSSVFFSENRHWPRVIMHYLEMGGIPPLSEGHSYYHELPKFVAIRYGHRMEMAKQFLRDQPGIVTRDLHFCIRRIARKGSYPAFLMDQTYRYFDHEKCEMTTLVMEDGFSIMKAVSELCAEACFDHKPVLQSLIETMIDTERELEARNVIRVHDQFAPTQAQCLEVQASYFTLLASPHKAIVAFAIETIGSFSNLPGFDAAGFIELVETVFTHNSNPLQIAALKLIKEVVTNNPRVADNVPGFIASALLNPNLKVQSAVLAVLKSLPTSAGAGISTAISPYADRILPSLKSEFAPWMTDDLPREEASPAALPQLHPEVGNPMLPISSAADLAFVANELLDRDLEPMRFEQFLDGLARYAADNRSLLADKFKPLQKRAFNFSSGEDNNGGAYPELLIFTSRLVLLFGANPPEPGDSSIEFPPTRNRWFMRVMEFARSRIVELLDSIRHGHNLPLLALPEFDFGFISPRTLLERFKSYKNSGLPPGHFDFIQALARCHLNGYDSEFIKLPASDDEPSRVLRFLFSGEIHGPIATLSWWLTAARTREPLGDFSKHPQLGSLDFKRLPDWCIPAIYQSPPSMRYDWHKRISPLLPKLDDDLPLDHLYPLQHGSIINTYGRYGSDLRWRYSFTPGLLDAVVAQDLQYIHHEAGLTEKTAINAASAVMSELAKRRLPLRYTMQVHLLMALNSPGRAEREAGVDLFIQASGDGRLATAVPGLGEVFSQLMHGDPDPEHGVLQLSRLVPSLRQLSTQDSRLQIQLRDILLRGFKYPPQSLPKGLPSLLELLLDLLLAHPPEHSIDLNSAWGGMLDGKSKSLATRISKIGKA